MRSIIGELYYGNITPCDRNIVKGSTYSHLRTFIKRIVVMDTMPDKKGKGIEVKLEYAIDGEYKTYPEQQDGKTA